MARRILNVIVILSINMKLHIVLFLELGVGLTTPGIIKYPFWQLTYQNLKATYVCINFGETSVPREIANRSICIDADIGEMLNKLK